MTATSWGQTLSNAEFVWFFFIDYVLTLTALIYIYIYLKCVCIYIYIYIYIDKEIYKYTVSEKQRDLSSYQFMHLSIPYTIITNLRVGKIAFLIN